MRKIILVLGSLALAIGLLYSFIVYRHWSDSSFHSSQISLPTNLQELVRVSDLIALGTVLDLRDGGVGQARSYGMPTDAVPTMTAEFAAGMISNYRVFEYPISYVDLRVDELLYAKPSVSIAAGSTITMSGGVDLASYVTPTPAKPWAFGDAAYRLRLDPTLPSVGEQRLFFLTAEGAEDLLGSYGSIYGAYSQLDLSGPKVRLSASPPIVIDITEHTAVPTFMNELRAVIQARQASEE